MYVGEIANAIELAPTRVAWMRLDVGSCYHRSTSDSPNLAIQCAKKKNSSTPPTEKTPHTNQVIHEMDLFSFVIDCKTLTDPS